MNRKKRKEKKTAQNKKKEKEKEKARENRYECRDVQKKIEIMVLVKLMDWNRERDERTSTLNSDSSKKGNQQVKVHQTPIYWRLNIYFFAFYKYILEINDTLL